MAINFNELEQALYHIRVNYLYCASTMGYRVQFSARGDGDTWIDIWDGNDKRVGHFRLSVLTEEIALLQSGKIQLCDLDSNEEDPLADIL